MKSEAAVSEARLCRAVALVLAVANTVRGSAPRATARMASLSGVMLATTAELSNGTAPCSTKGWPAASVPTACSSSGPVAGCSVSAKLPSAALVVPLPTKVPVASTTCSRAPAIGAPKAATPLRRAVMVVAAVVPPVVPPVPVPVPALGAGLSPPPPPQAASNSKATAAAIGRAWRKPVKEEVVKWCMACSRAARCRGWQRDTTASPGQPLDHGRIKRDKAALFSPTGRCRTLIRIHE